MFVCVHVRMCECMFLRVCVRVCVRAQEHVLKCVSVYASKCV